ncbi:MAG: STAS domain-containing protein [Streptosporangiales bacterium]
MTGQLFTAETLTDSRPGWRLAGEVDLASRKGLTSVLDKVTGQHCDTKGLIHLELAELEFIDLAGTEALIRTANAVYEASGARLALHHPPYSLRRVAGLLLDHLDLDADDILTLPPVADRRTGRPSPYGIA